MSEPNLVARGFVVVLALGGFVLLGLNLGLINRSLYDFGIWAVPPLGAIAGMLFFGLIWGGRPIMHKMLESE